MVLLMVVFAGPIMGVLANVPGVPAAALTNIVYFGGAGIAGLAFAKMLLNAFTGNRF